MTKPSNKADLTKLSHLIRAGAIVHTMNGGVYRCTSKFASNDGVLKFRLADLQGKPVQTPADFHPVSPALARFAAWMRYVVAYNKDFDLYVKEYIRRAGLPVDPEMNWSKFLARVVATKLISRDPEVQDEALHQIIIKALAERSILDSTNPNGFSHAIKKFPAGVQKLPLAKQVTRFLEKAFAWRVKEANDYIKKYVFQTYENDEFSEHEKSFDTLPSLEMNDTDDDESSNLLDVEGYTTTGDYDIAEADIEMERFREGFGNWLHKKFREDTADQYLALFDVVYEEVKASEDTPGAADVLPEWYRQVGKRCLRCNGTGFVVNDTRTRKEKTKGLQPLERKECPKCEGRGATEGKSVSWFKVLFSNLPKLLDLYISKYLSNAVDVHPFLEIMRQINKYRELAATASIKPHLNDLKLADSEMFGLPVAPMDKGGDFVKDLISPGGSGSSGSGSNGGGGGFMGNIGDAVGGGGAEAGEAAGGIAEAVEAVAPLVALASKQWEVPKCKACGGTKDNTDCLGCHERFCPDCLINHHANNPSHNRIASLADDYKQGDNYYSCAVCNTKNWTREKDGSLRCLTCHPREKTAALCNEKDCSGSKEGESYCDACDRCEKHCICDRHVAMDTALDMDASLDTKRIIEDVIGSGLFSDDEGEDFFSWRGCEYCQSGGATVRKFEGYRNLKDAQAPNHEELKYDFQICSDCLYKLVYGEEGQ